MSKEISKSHLDKFTGIYDMNGVPICNGDTICVYEKSTYNHTNLRVVAWKNGSYYAKDCHCEYNIYAWRKSIEVMDSPLPSIYEVNSTDEEIEAFLWKEVSFMGATRKNVVDAFRDGMKFAQQQLKLKDNG